MGMKLSKEEATKFFADFYRGEHHFPAEIKPFGEGWSMSHMGDLATYDGDDLTRLVLLAHEECIRVAIDSGGPRRVRIAIWKREREGPMYARHPTIEQVLEKRREAMQ